MSVSRLDAQSPPAAHRRPVATGVTHFHVIVQLLGDVKGLRRLFDVTVDLLSIGGIDKREALLRGALVHATRRGGAHITPAIISSEHASLRIRGAAAGYLSFSNPRRPPLIGFSEMVDF